MVKKPEEIRTLGNLGVDKKLSNSTLKKCNGRVRIGLMWLVIRTSGELLCKLSRNFGFHVMCGFLY